MNTSEIIVSVSIPYSNKEEQKKAEISLTRTTSVSSISARIIHLFPSLQEMDQFEVMLSLVDGTYVFADPSKPISVYPIPEKPTICIIPKEVEMEFQYGVKQPFKYTVTSRDTVSSVLDKICKNMNAIKGNSFVLVDNKFPLLNTLSIFEQRPGLHKLDVLDSSSDKVKLTFSDLYLHGPVYLSLSDALHLSAYLLQASIGPARCYTGGISSLKSYLPERLQNAQSSSVDLHLEWSFLNKTPREEAIKHFTENVQLLPLFNCTSFTGDRAKSDKTSTLPDRFELIFTTRRIIFLDYIKFKTRLSIPYDDILSIMRTQSEIEINYTDDSGVSEKGIRFSSETSKTLFRKIVEIEKNQEEADNLTNFDSYLFRTLENIANDPNRPKSFPLKFLSEFAQLDEKDDRASNADLMHALLIRADSCAWHLSVLMSKVTKNNAKLLKNEIAAYHSRLMAYLTYLTYDHRPFDNAYELGKLIVNLGEEYEQCTKLIAEVLQNLDVVKRSFVPISTDPLYICSRNVVAYLLSHLLSYMELPYATPEQNHESFEKIESSFLINGMEIKELVNQYLFSVGDVEIKTDLQKHLDFVFKHHLSSLTTFPLIVNSSEFGAVDPSIILHQDSCNIMMTSMVEFSRMLWEDRKQLSDDQLASLLEQARLLVQDILSDENNNNIIVRSIEEFCKVVNVNLQGLLSTTKMLFNLYQVYARRLIDSFIVVPNFSGPHMKLRLLQVASVLILIQPKQLFEESQKLLDKLRSLGRETYDLIINDIPSFDLLVNEGRDNNLCALKIYMNEHMKKKAEESTLAELYNELLPAYALQKRIDHQVSEWGGTFVQIYSFTIWFVQAICTTEMYQIKLEVLGNAGEKEKKILAEIPDLDEHSLIIPSISNKSIIEFTKKVGKSNEIIDYFSNVTDIYPIIIKVASPEQVRIIVDAHCWTSIVLMNNVIMNVTTNQMNAAAAFPQAYIYMQILGFDLYELAKQPGYFSAPIHWLFIRKHNTVISNGIKAFFSINSISNNISNSLQNFSEYINKINSLTYYTELTSLCPLEEFNFDIKIDPSFNENHRTDMAEYMCEYRVLKSEMVECLNMREKDNIEAIVKSIGKAIQGMIGLLNHVAPGSEIPNKLVESINIFIKDIPRIYTYKLGTSYLRESLNPVDAYVDEVVDTIAEKLYETVDISRVNDLIKNLEGSTYKPDGRNKFVKDFVSVSKKYAGTIQGDDENVQILYEMLMLLQDNKMQELKQTAKTLPDEADFVKCFKSNDYYKLVKNCEKTVEKIEYSECFIWFKNGVKEICEQIKQQDYKEDTIKGLKELRHRINSAFNPSQYTISLIKENIEAALGLINVPALKQMNDQISAIENNIKKVEELYQICTRTLHVNTEFGGNSLIYKDGIQQIISSFRNEYTLQDWNTTPFSNLTKCVIIPLSHNFESAYIADAILLIRRTIRSLRITKRDIRARFAIDTERMLNKLEESLQESFNQIENKNLTRLERQHKIIKKYIDRFATLRQSRIKGFVVRLMENLESDLTSFNTFEADQLSRSVFRLFNELADTNDRAQQVDALIDWITHIDRGILPIDYDRLLEILQSVHQKLDQNEEELFVYDQDFLVDIAIRLSNALALLGKIRDSLALVKDMHKLYKIKDVLTKFIMTVMRALEAYADEIHTFPQVNHPVLSVIQPVSDMCCKMEELIEASFLLADTTSRLANETKEQIQEFVNSCPSDLKDTMEQVSQDPMKVLSQFTEK